MLLLTGWVNKAYGRSKLTVPLGTPVLEYPFVLGINRVVGGPAVVGGPGQVAALKQQIAGAVIADDEDDVALQVFFLGGQFPQVDAAQPILGDLEFHGGLPLAFAHIVFANRRFRLWGALYRIKRLNESSAVSVVVAGSIDLQLERRLPGSRSP